MKKLGLIISALALLLGMSQCAKKPNMPTFGGGKTTPKEITFSVNGNDGQKGDFSQVTEVLDYTWRAGDKIYVYSSNNALVEDNKTDFNAGYYCGVLDIVSGVNAKSATFKGTINVPDLAQTLRFVHFGTGVAIGGNETDGFSGSASFATQNGALTGDNSVSSKVIALCDKEYDENVSEYAVGSLQVQFGVVRFSFEEFTDDAVVVSRISKNALKVNNNGSVEYYVEGENLTLTDIDDNKTMYYAVLMPKSPISYVFTQGSQAAYKKAEIKAGIFYTEGATGNSVVLDLIPEGALPGKFSVSSTEKIRFAKGNLVYDDGTFSFHNQQWGRCFTSNGDVSSAYKSTGRFDLFGWGTGSLDEISGRYVQPWATAKTVANATKYGPTHEATNHLNEGAPSGTNYSVYDWGHNMTPASTWFTLSNSEWEYLMSNSARTYRFYRAKVHGVKGLILLPDEWTNTDEKDCYLCPKENYNKSAASFVSVTDEQWTECELTGAAFLPAAGGRSGTDVTFTNERGYYWSSTISMDLHKNEGSSEWHYGVSYIVGINDDTDINALGWRYRGLSVRLARLLE